MTIDLSTAGATWFRLAVAPPRDGEPWFAARAVEALRQQGAVVRGTPDVLGAGRGEPLLTRHDLDWLGLRLQLEYHRYREGDGEIALALPPWDEIDAATQEAIWELIDTLAAAVDALHGGAGDEDALIDGGGRRLAARLARGPAIGCTAARTLHRSGLTVLLESSRSH